MASTFTTNKHIELPANGDDVGSWDVPVNGDFTIIDKALGGTIVINVTAASGNVVLALNQYTPPIIELSGALTAAVNYEFPAGVGWIGTVLNNTTGAHAITFASATGGSTQTVIPQGFSVALFCDGSNTSLQTTTGALPAGSNTWVQYNAAGALAGTANFTFDGSNVGIGGALEVVGNFILLGNVTSGLNVAANAETPEVAVAFSATAMAINCSLSNVFSTVFTANVTVAPALTNLHDGQTINWFITQDATGSRTMTWPTAFKWAGGSAGVLSTAANAVDLLVATYRAATGNWYASLSKGFA